MNNIKRIKPDTVRFCTSILDDMVLEKAFSTVFSRLDVSPETRQDYQSRFTEFWYLLEFHGLHTDSLLEYKQLLATDNTTTVSTKNKRLTVARLFLRELHRSGILSNDITAGVKNFKQSGLHKKTGLDDADIKKIRNWIHDGSPPTRQRIRVYSLLMLLAYHGLRSVEICRLKYEDIDFINSIAMVQGKGTFDKERVHLHKSVLEMIKSYSLEYGVQSGPLFFSVSNSSYGEPLTTRGLRRIVTTVLERLEIDKSVHGFRHYYVTKLVKAYRGDLFRVMQFTRHKSLSMLQVYNDEALHEEQYPVHDHIFAHVL